MKSIFRTNKGITLIALVVTIVILLILAGVSISLVLDNNGIIGKSKESRLETRASQVEDEIGLWKQNNFIKSETGESIENANAVLQSLLLRKLLNEDEIDRENEIITIKRNDGSILKQIEYGNVKINISKTPATEKSGVVILKVESVEGLTIPTIKNEEELSNFINSLSENQKKEIIRNGYIKVVNKQDPSANCTTFQEALEWAKKQQMIDEATEDAFWTAVKTSELGINGITGQILFEFYYNKSTKMIEGYTVINPDNENSNTYIATANGTYTFKIQDLVTGKIYTKKVEITNIGENTKYYVTNIKQSDINNNTAQVITKLATRQPIKLAKTYGPWWCVALRDKETNSLQTFTTAYIIYNNQMIDISSKIFEKNGYSFIIGHEIKAYLSNKLENFDSDKFYSSEQQFIIEKDEVYYVGNAKVCDETNSKQ